MLKKLLKYDLISIFKVLSIFYILSIVFAIITRIFLSIENSFILNIIAQICSGTTISMIINILINNIMRLWVRFKQNLYGDESYLTHTLPVTKISLYTSKFLTSLITLMTSMIVIVITIIIAYYSKSNFDIIKNLITSLSNSYNISVIPYIIFVIIIFYLELINLLQSGYTGIILGHKMNNYKILYSVLLGFITYIITQIFAILSILIFSLFNNDLIQLFKTSQLTDINLLKLLLIVSTITYLLIIIIVKITNIKLFKRGVNVD